MTEDRQKTQDKQIPDKRHKTNRQQIVIPAKAGIQKNKETGFRVKHGMTNCDLITFNI